MRVVVTGGCGFTGSAVARAHLDRGDKVLVIDQMRKSQQVPALAPCVGKDGFVRLEMSAADRSLMRAVFKEFRPEKIYHLTGSNSEHPDDQYSAEIETAHAVMEAALDTQSAYNDEARENFRLICAHRHINPPADAPLTPQLAACQTGSQLLTTWPQARNLAAVHVRADEVFGPHAGINTFIARLLEAFATETGFTLENSGARYRDWLPIHDFVQGLIAAGAKGTPHTIYDLTVGAERREIDIAEMICAEFDTRAPDANGSWKNLISFAPSTNPATATRSPSLTQPESLDETTAERDLGWVPQGFYAGLDRTLNWATRNRQHANALKQAAE